MKKVAETEPPVITPVEENKLAPITAIEADIARMKAQYQGLSIKGPDDKEGFNSVASARKDVKKAMVSVEKIRKSLVDDAVKWQRQVNTAARGITEKLEEVKRPLELMETQYTLAVEQQKQYEQQQRELKIQSRAESILKLNARFNGTHFTLGEISISQSAIERLEDADFESELLLMTQESEAILLKEDAEKQAQEGEKKRLKDEADKLKAAQDQLDKDRAELEALRASMQPAVQPVEMVIPPIVTQEDPFKPEVSLGEVYVTPQKTSFEEMIANPVIGRSNRAIPPQVPPVEEPPKDLLKSEAEARYGKGTPEAAAFIAGARYILDKNL